MKLVYPVLVTKGKKYLIVSVPDCEIDTQGKDLADAIEMARDAISIWGLAEIDEGRPLPQPSPLQTIKSSDGDIVTLVDVDLDEYRKKLSSFSIRKSLTLPSWLNARAESAGVNFSQTLQRALKQELGIAD